MGKEDGVDKITGLYAALLISVALIAVPQVFISVVSGAIFVCLVLFAYMILVDEARESFAGSHAAYITRSFWAGALIFGLSLVALIAVMSALAVTGHMSTAALAPCSGGDLTPCLPLFINDNGASFTVASFVALGPSILYLLFRFAQGLIRARGGKSFIA